MPLPPTIVPFVPRAIDAALREHVLELVTQLEAEHGAGREPNPRASSRKEIRFGKKGSLAVVVAGENKGRITDHEEESRGEAPLRYIARMKGLDEHSALLWSKDWLVENGYLSAATKAAKHAPKPKSGPAAESGTRDSTKAAKVWGEARSIEDTLAERYLREKRGFGDGPLPVDNLRLHPGIWAEERTWPALLAAAFDEKGQIARIVAVLLDRGTADKAPVGTQKLTFGRGAAEYPVKFDANLPSADPLLLTEGPEDAIAIWSAFAGNRHAAASLGAVNLSKAKITGDVVVCGDNDSVGYEKALVAAKALAARGCQVAIAFPPSGIKDFNDLFDAKGAEAVQAAIEAAEPYVPTPAEIEEASVEKWQDALLLGQGGAPLAVEANVITTLRLHPDLAGKVRLNEFAQDVECADMPWRRGEGWRAWTDDDDTGLAEWCQHHRIMTKPAAVMPAVYRVAADHPHHPVHDYVESLAWDGVPRLDTWPERYLGATIEPGREEYLRQVGRRWFISLVARGSDEGCKVDHLLVLEGRQGAGKSSALAALVPEPGWFTDEIADLGSKDSAQDLRGKLLIEIAELSALRRGEVERIKAYLSRSTDHYRPSYGRRSRDFPRQCVFAGTTNSDAYLQDETGNRRFWGVKVGTIDLDALKRDRDQL
jgi:hypothetical protein